MASQTAQALQAYAGIALAVLTLLTLCVLIWYTRETVRLRKAAEKTNSMAILPAVVLSVDEVATTFTIRNFGNGSAFNVAIKDVSGRGGASVKFKHPEMLAAGEGRPAVPELWRPRPEPSGKTVNDLLVIRDELLSMCPIEVSLTYRSADGTDYQTEQLILKDTRSGRLVIQYIKQRAS
jgi:hypothetical protein